MHIEEIVRQNWARQGGRYAFVSTRRKGKWKDIPLLDIDDSPLDVSCHKQDVYFSPLTFGAPQRANDTATGIRCLFADLDPSNPEYLAIRPTIAWMTSPGNFAAIWWLYEEISYSRFANLNRRLTMMTGADVGGWMGSKVLRWPGTLNHKYDPPERGELLWFEDHNTYTVEAFEDSMPDIPAAPNVGPDFHPDPIAYLDAAEYTNDYWKAMTLRGRAMLMKKKVPDRSLHIVRTIHELLRKDIYPAAIFQLIWWRPWNKWRTDRHRPEQLWAEICRASIRLVE